MDMEFDPRIPIESAATPPATWCTDAAVFAAEKRRVFEKAWVAVGRTDQLELEGSYFTGSLVGNSYIVLRDDHGSLRAFHNVCRRHAAVVAQECGWTYGLDGRLKRAPRMGRMDGGDLGKLSLPPISVEEWGPFVLIDMNGAQGGEGNPSDLPRDVAPLAPRLEELGFQQMKWVERREYSISCNWKVFVENSLDGGYQVAYAHEQLAGSLEFDGYATSIFDRSSIQVCAASGEDDRLGKKVTYAWLYPNFFINRYGRMMDTNLVLPVAVDRCQVVFDFYVDYEDVEEWNVKRTIRKSIKQSHVIQQEDIDICESTQRGLQSMSFSTGRYSSLLEQSVHAFHKILGDEIKDDLAL